MTMLTKKQRVVVARRAVHAFQRRSQLRAHVGLKRTEARALCFDTNWVPKTWSFPPDTQPDFVMLWREPTLLLSFWFKARSVVVKDLSPLEQLYWLTRSVLGT